MTWSKTPEQRQQDASTYNGLYRRRRREALARARYRCEIRTDGICTGRATETDHINGAANDPEHLHLRAACGPCHRHRTATEQAGGNRSAPDPEPTPRTDW
jgi:hypothetical protein